MDEINVRVFPNHAVKASSLLRPTFTNANAIASESMTRIGMYVCMHVCMYVVSPFILEINGYTR